MSSMTERQWCTNKYDEDIPKWMSRGIACTAMPHCLTRENRSCESSSLRCLVVPVRHEPHRRKTTRGAAAATFKLPFRSPVNTSIPVNVILNCSARAAPEKTARVKAPQVMSGETRQGKTDQVRQIKVR
ncbi:hypothetical protein E2C01_088023 [Portunus trituberculatus]|uniref:Uncharacterized protein n=1 Tax=Portunus trituberculatus TaxID=210409 RepID=A0A5B7J837_PORTR|nr:hypothetical protein [Portunus trituberculatus]